MADRIDINNIPKEKFVFATRDGALHDKKLDTKPVGYLKDAWNRFRKNVSSIVGAIIVILLVIYSIIGPFLYDANFQDSYKTNSTTLQYYKELLPKLPNATPGSGFWDGTKVQEITEVNFIKYMARGYETGRNPIVEVLEVREIEETVGKQVNKKTLYTVRIDVYANINMFEKALVWEDYLAIQEYQNETGRQVILPYIDNNKVQFANKNDKNYWYKCDKKSNALDASGKKITDLIVEKDGEYTVAVENLVPGYLTYNVDPDMYTSIRLENDPGNWLYAKATGAQGGDYTKLTYNVRLDPYEYFIYMYDYEPYFLFGSNEKGYDIFSRLALGARFSLLFALAVSIINLFIGTIYGAIEGYYGGAADLIMERISDILSAIPSMIVTVLFNLHLTKYVGVVPALVYAFILTGWIGMASRVRMQFYRFKNQEYVLAARTLGARDRRIMFKHIFPNSLGTIITGSVLVIPGVIFSETSLTYLGIINLDSTTMTSVGAMLNAGKDTLSSYPHIVLFPALFIGLLMIAFNMFGNGLRDAFNPSLRGVEE